MSDIVTITYVYGSLSYVTDVEAGSKIIVEKDPFYISGKKIIRYAGSNSTAYYPGQLITAPAANITLTVAEIADIGYVKVHQTNSVKDISDMIVKIVEKKGKNQPFSYVTISVLKELFIDANIDLVQKETVFDLNVYGITGKWTYERLEDNDSIYDITLVNNAYYLKTITLLSLLNFEILNNGAKIKLTNLDNLEANITWSSLQNQSNTEYGTFITNSLTFTIKRVNTAGEGQSPTYDYSLIKVDGTANNIFKFIVKNVAGYTNADIDFGESPNLYGRYYSDNPANIYTTQQIDALTPTNISNQGVFTVVSLRLDEYCWNIIQNLALLTDRYAFFDDKAHLITFDKNYDKDIIVDWEEPTAQSLGDYGEYRPIMALSSNEDQGSQYVLASQKVICEAYETTVAISDTASTDIGKDIVFNSPDNTKIDTSQSDNTSRNQQARIIALNSLKRYYKPGDCIRYSICESKFPTPSSTVNNLANVPTATAVDQCFKYETVLEGTNIKIFETYFVSKNVGTSGNPTYIWVEYDTDNPEREQAYTVKTCARSVEDRQNNITITNVPLALMETEYPACVTTYTWGMPEFMDEQSQFKDLTAVAQDAVLDNTSDTQISSCDASKIVVGNQSISELREDRSGFTGLIMEKNVDNQVYRLVGYHQGVAQAEFNSFGEIQSGGGNVVINHSGITLNGGVDIILPSDGSKIIARNVVLDSSGLNAYTNVNPAIEDPQQWGTNTLSIGASGNIEAGSGAVQIGVIGTNNLVTKNGNTIQCYISNTGELMAGAGAVKLNSSGLTISDKANITLGSNSSLTAGAGTVVLNSSGLTISDKANITLGSNSKVIAGNVILNNTGLKSYSSISSGSGVGNPLVSIGADGNIEAGNGAIKIGAITSGANTYNLVTYKNLSNVQCYINSDGELMAGGGTVKLNASGLTISDNANITLGASSKIIASNVILDSNGLKSYNSVTDGTGSGLRLSIGSDGNIIAGGGAVKMGVIDSYNFATYNGSTVQCYIDTNGKFVAGAGAISIDSTGISVYNGSTLQTKINTSGDIVSGDTIIINQNGITGYYSAPITSSTKRSIVISKNGTIAIGGNLGKTIQITGGDIKFFALGSTIGSDGTVTGNPGAYITDAGMVTGLADDSVDTAQIVADAVTNAKIAINAIDEDNIQENAVTNAKIANASISTAKIQNAAITTALIDNLAVTNAKIDRLAVGKIQTGILSADCNIILANTGSELLAGPYASTVSVDLSLSQTTYSDIPKGTYVRFYSSVSTDSVTYTGSYTWMIQQGANEWGGIIPTGSTSGQFTFSFKYKPAQSSEVTKQITLNTTASTAGPAYRVRLNKDGLSTYDEFGNLKGHVGTDGYIYGTKVEATDVIAGTLNSGVIYAGTISASKITSGDIAANETITLKNTGSEIRAGRVSDSIYRLRINKDGLFTYKQDGTQVCSIDTDGNISNVKVEATNVKAGQLSAGVIYAGDIGADQITAGEISANQYITLKNNGAEIRAGEISTGKYKLRINKDGLFTYSEDQNNNNPICSIGTDGNITGVTVAADHITAGAISANQAITLKNTGAEIRAGEVSSSIYKVRLNQSGLTTYKQDGSVACSVGTDGNINGIKINADQINTSTLSANTITLNGGAIVAGGANFNSDGVTIDLPTSNPSLYASTNALKFYDSTHHWTPYKLYATYDSSGATSIVKAESKTTGTTIASKLKMVVDDGGAYGKFTPYTSNSTSYDIYSGLGYGYSNFTTTDDYIWLYIGNGSPKTLVTPSNKDSLNIVPGTTVAYEYNINYNQITSKLREYTGSGKTSWTGNYTESDLPHYVTMGPGEYYEVSLVMTDSDTQSVSITTPNDSRYISCEFVAYMANETSYIFKKYSDDGESARGTRYVFTTGVSTITRINMRVGNASTDSVVFYWKGYPVNTYRSSGGGASIALNQEGTTIQGNNTITGQLYQSGGPIYFKGAGVEIPTYFDMPIVPYGVISQNIVSGSAISSRGDITAVGNITAMGNIASAGKINTNYTTLNDLACRRIYIASVGTTPSGDFHDGDIILYYTT